MIGKTRRFLEPLLMLRPRNTIKKYFDEFSLISVLYHRVAPAPDRAGAGSARECPSFYNLFIGQDTIIFREFG